MESFREGSMERSPADLRQACVDELFTLAEEAYSLVRDGDAPAARLLVRVEAVATVGGRRLAERVDGDEPAEIAAGLVALLADAARELRTTTSAAVMLGTQIERSVALLRELAQISEA